MPVAQAVWLAWALSGVPGTESGVPGIEGGRSGVAVPGIEGTGVPGIEWAYSNSHVPSLGAMLAKLLAPGAAANWVAPQGTSLLAQEQEALEGKAAVEEPARGLRRHSPGGSRATAEAGCPRWLYAI